MYESVIIIISILFFNFWFNWVNNSYYAWSNFFLPGYYFPYIFSVLDISRGEFLIISLVTILVFFLDYIFQYFGVKKLGGGRMSVLGLFLGTILGLFFCSIWITFRTFLGAFIGAIFENKNKSQSIKVAIGSLIGFISGSVLKLTFSVFLLWIFFKSI